MDTPDCVHIHLYPFWIVIILINGGVGHTPPQTVPAQSTKGLLIHFMAVSGQLGCFCSLAQKALGLHCLNILVNDPGTAQAECSDGWF